MNARAEALYVCRSHAHQFQDEFSQPAVCEAERKILNPELDPANDRMSAIRG